jgi:hypothetical protein
MRAMTSAVRLTLTGSGFFVIAGTVAVVLGLGHRPAVRPEAAPEDPRSKLAQAIEQAAPELLDEVRPPPIADGAGALEKYLPPEHIEMEPQRLDTLSGSKPAVFRAGRTKASVADLGYVRVTTQPWGWATVGDQRIETVGSARLTLAPGRHTITIHCAECTPHRTTTRVVTVKPNMTELVVISWDEERARERAAPAHTTGE